jgi:uncharacterized protein (DUF4415 family)
MSVKSIGKAQDKMDLNQLDAMSEEDIEMAAQSDPDTLLLEDCDMASLQVVMPKAKQSISLRVDPDVLSFFKSYGKGYQTRMNAVLRAFMNAQDTGEKV